MTGGGNSESVEGWAAPSGHKVTPVVPPGFTLFTVWSMQAVAGREGGVVLFSGGNPYITF